MCRNSAQNFVTRKVKNMGRIEPEPEKKIKKVVIHYDDGEEKEIEKGFFCELQPKDEMQILLERYAYSEISGTFILI